MHASIETSIVFYPSGHNGLPFLNVIEEYGMTNLCHS